MFKQVRLTYGVYAWLREKNDVVDADWIISIVRWTAQSERKYYQEKGKERFYIPVKRKIENQKKTLIVRVEETDSEFVVVKVHLEDSWSLVE